MSLVFLCLALAALWINLLGAGLAAWPLVRDYAISRFAGLLAIVLCAFFLEHFIGWGPRPPLLPLTTAGSLWLMWRHRAVLMQNWKSEAAFAAGFMYCFVWRYTFPDIDWTGEKMPNLAMIEAYMRGTRLPPPDVWLPPFRLNFYYSLQHYGAALLGRLLDLGPGVSYHLAYCTLVGFITLLSASCVARLCARPLGRVVGVLSLLLGGSGAVVAAHALLHRAHMIDTVRFVGGSIVRAKTNALGTMVAAWMAKPGIEPRDLPMEPMSYIVVNGDYHPPLSGYVLLAFAATLIAAQSCGAQGRARWINNVLLAATLPVSLISNAWILPLLCILVGGWFLYRAVSGDRDYLIPGLLGLAAATALEYPYLIEFTQQAISNNAAIGFTPAQDHTPVLGWILTFWPVTGILILGLFNRDRRSLVLFLVVIWAVELAATELLYNHDMYGGAWIRFNTTLKWWSWVYAGIVLTVGAANLGSSSRLCRVGTMVMLLPTLAFAYDLGVTYRRTAKDSVGKLDGYGWIKDPVLRDLIGELRSRPDGVALESGVTMANTDSPSITLFSGKFSFIGWPWHETTWRGPFEEIGERMHENDAFFAGKCPDPLDWLLSNNIRYVLWLPRDNVSGNVGFRPLLERIRPRYVWHHVYGENDSLQIGFWERIDDPRLRQP